MGTLVITKLGQVLAHTAAKRKGIFRPENSAVLELMAMECGLCARPLPKGANSDRLRTFILCGLHIQVDRGNFRVASFRSADRNVRPFFSEMGAYNKNTDVSVNYFLPSKADSDKMSLLLFYKKEIFELDNIHYSQNVFYRNPKQLKPR
ncbi:hypothetical protein BpHYR1_026777 [Brachionus plicatilis]|uniref:Uncharacterized protein n=1 Tax=Brachionus plicatilis TaxID=10195 RepID=A0A3M7Q9K1_BRAPC|nr:hypothetical protein BpHYR1_026777 [Brachionus plicatilis]